MTKVFISLLLAGSLLSSCTKTSDTDDAFDGTWQEKRQAQAFSGVANRFTFLPDHRFQLQVHIWTDIADTSNKCDTRTDYMAGNYSITDHIISFNGKYTDKAYVPMMNPCLQQTDYQQQFAISYNGGELIFQLVGRPGQIRLYKE